MTRTTINGVEVYANKKIFSEEELARYVDYAKEKVKPCTLAEIDVVLSDENHVNIEYETKDKFERIRRITGYLTGTLDSWNDSKRAEERERVKHYA